MRLQTFVVAALLLPATAAAQSQARPVVIRASTVLDGKGGVLRDVALVIEGTKIVRISATGLLRAEFPAREFSPRCAPSLIRRAVPLRFARSCARPSPMAATS